MHRSVEITIKMHLNESLILTLCINTVACILDLFIAKLYSCNNTITNTNNKVHVIANVIAINDKMLIHPIRIHIHTNWYI